MTPTVDPQTLARCRRHESFYRSAADEAGIPWPILAGIDERECSCAPDRSTLSGEKLGTPNPDDPSVTAHTKLESIRLAAAHVVAMARMVYGVDLAPDSAGDDVIDALVAYNRGFIQRWAGVPTTDSPYAMNDPSAPMTWPVILRGAGDPRNPGEPDVTRGKVERGRWGAYWIFVALSGGVPDAPDRRRRALLVMA